MNKLTQILTIGLYIIIYGPTASASYEESIDSLISAALSGDGMAASTLGYHYYHEPNNSSNRDLTFKFLTMAAENEQNFHNPILGICHLKGIGTTPDYEKAIEFFNQSLIYKLEERLCLYYLGLCNEKGYGLPQDKNKAILYYHKCIEHNPSLCGSLDDIYKSLAETRLAELEPDKAIEHYIQAFNANMNNIMASYALGCIKIRNQSEKNNGMFYFERAYHILKQIKASELNKIYAEDYWGYDNESAINACIGCSKVEDLIISKNLYSITDSDISVTSKGLIEELVIEPLRLAHEFGSKEASYLLGMMLLKYSFPAEEAVKAFKQSMLYESQEGAFEYARCLIIGKGIEKDSEAGLHILSILAKKNFAKSYYELGTIALKEKSDFKNVETLLKKSGELGYAEAYFLLGRLHKDRICSFEERWVGDDNKPIIKEWPPYQIEIDQDVAASHSKYVDYMRKAADMGHPDAYFELYECTKERDKALGLLFKAQEAGSINAMNRMAYVLHTVEKDYKGAYDLYLQTACRGDAVGMYQLGLMRYNGYGYDQNYSLALSLFKEASQLSYPPADLILAECYRKGIGIGIDRKKAVKHYEKYSQYNWDGYYKLGEYYYKDLSNYEAALKYFRKAIEIAKLSTTDNPEAYAEYIIPVLQKNGNPYASTEQNKELLGEVYCLMAECYRFGRGVTRDEEIALDYTIKSIECGNAKAKEIYNDIYASDAQ